MKFWPIRGHEMNKTTNSNKSEIPDWCVSKQIELELDQDVQLVVHE